MAALNTSQHQFRQQNRDDCTATTVAHGRCEAVGLRASFSLQDPYFPNEARKLKTPGNPAYSCPKETQKHTKLQGFCQQFCQQLRHSRSEIMAAIGVGEFVKCVQFELRGW
jgi:hypothetical protein